MGRWFRTAVQPRWLAALLLALLVAGVFWRMGLWQWHRHEAKVHAVERIESHRDAPAVPYTDLVRPDRLTVDCKNQDDFLVAGRRLGGLLYTGTMSAVVLGGASTIGSAPPRISSASPRCAARIGVAASAQRRVRAALNRRSVMGVEHAAAWSSGQNACKNRHATLKTFGRVRKVASA